MAASRPTSFAAVVVRIVIAVLALAMMYFFADRFTGGRITDEIGQRVNTSSPGATTTSSVPGLAYTDAELAEARTAIELVGTAPDSDRLRKSYDRTSQFGRWRSTDGCDTRQRILARDLVDIEQRDGCKITVGTLHDPYTGRTFLVRDPQWAGPLEEGEIRVSEIEIDHIVATSRAWMHGADGWSKDKRVQFANDPRNLLAVDGGTNGGKSDSGLADWSMPYEPSTCGYVVKFTLIVDDYGLTMTPEDKRFAHDKLEQCR